MIIDVRKTCMDLLNEANIKPCLAYEEVINRVSQIGLASNTKVMYELNKYLFDDKTMLARKLYQHSVYEALGGQVIEMFADRFASGKLKDDLKNQAKDEVKHGKMLANLIKFTGENIEQIKAESSSGADEEMPDFKDNIKIFVFFIHTAEIRTLVMLHQYLDIIKNQISNNDLRHMTIPLEHIQADEKRHAAYTGDYINEWLKEDKSLDGILENTFLYTNKESWQEISNLASCFAQRHVAIN